MLWWRYILLALTLAGAPYIAGAAADDGSATQIELERLKATLEDERTQHRKQLILKDNEIEQLTQDKRIAWAYTQALMSITLLLLLGSAGLLVWRQRRDRRRLQRLAETDGLTGLLNHRRIFEEADRVAARAWHASDPLSVIVADIDHFKTVNDSHGHAEGDRVIQRVAAALSAGLREGDRAGRLGGEEFLLLLPGSRADGAELVAERIRQAIAGGDGSEIGEAISVTASFGVAELSEAHGNFSKLFRIADERLFEAKQGGRNRVVGARRAHLSSVE